jgi:serine/threonine protein kinase
MTYPFTNLRPFQAGGNGDLYIGQLSSNGETVVVKMLREYTIGEARRGFAREVRMLGRGIPGVVPLLFADTEGPHPCYVMPYLKGGALTRYVGRLTDIQMQMVSTELANTLAKLHSAFEVHGDFKTDNVLVNDDGRVQIADPLGNGTFFTMLFAPNHGGTPGFWPPEIRAGGPISYAGDVYSLGATVYHLQTGRRPQDGQRLDPASEGFTNAPNVRELIVACCQLDPGARPTMQEVLRILRGERWADIRATRRQVQEFFKVACVVTIGVALAVALSNGGNG